MDPVTKEVKSEILEDWHFEDETTLVMKLKDNVYFSNGDKATAEDVLFSYSSHVDRSSAYIWEFNILYDECEIVDELTLKMKFSTFYSAFFSSYIIYLYDKSWAESVGWDSLDWQKPVGTGPYVVSDYKIDDHATFTARDDYWNKDKDPVTIREWVLKYYKDNSTMEMDLEAGNIAMCQFTASEYERFQKDGGKGYDVLTGSAGVNHFFQMGFLENDCWYDKQLMTAAGYSEEKPQEIHTVTMESPYFSKCCEAFEYYCNQMYVKFTFDLKDIAATINDWNTPGSGVECGFYYDNFGSQDGQYVRGLDWAANPNGPYSEMTFQVGYRTDVFGKAQMERAVMNSEYWNLANMSYASAWN